MLVEVTQTPWATEFPSAVFTSTQESLSQKHPTLACEVVNGISPQLSFSADLNSEHLTSLQSLSRSLRENNYAIRTEGTYCHWVMRFLLSVNNKPVAELSELDVKVFLSTFAIRRNASRGTQNVALNAIVYHFKHLIARPLGDFSYIRSERPPKLPFVLTHPQLYSLFELLSGRHLLMAEIMYGTGLRLIECVRLRVKDIDFNHQIIQIIDG